MDYEERVAYSHCLAFNSLKFIAINDLWEVCVRYEWCVVKESGQDCKWYWQMNLCSSSKWRLHSGHEGVVMELNDDYTNFFINIL